MIEVCAKGSIVRASNNHVMLIVNKESENDNLPAEDLMAEPVADNENADAEAPLPPLLAWAKEKADALLNLVDRCNQFLAPQPNDAPDNPVAMARRPILVGAWLVIGLFGFVGMWAALAPLASAAIAPGKVILSGNHKTVQHLEGGVVDDILVREGETVKAGQVLVKLNETAAKARQDLHRKQWLASKAAEARLLAERDEKEEITYPDALQEALKDPEIREIVDGQRRLFESRSASLKSQIGLLEKQREQYRKEISGLEAQIEAATRQIALLEEEISAVRTLLKQGNAQKPRLLALQRQQAELKGERGEYQASISRAEQAIAESELQMINVKNEYQNKVATEMQEVVEKIADLQERLKASGDVLDRIVITAPLSGIVTDLQIHTIGGVIRPGDKIMDIVPIDELLVETQVSPQDIDVVYAGLEARVRLTAYKARSVPPILGTVTHVSPDRFEDQQTGNAYYKARIQIAEDELDRYDDLQLTPGMPAEALIVTGSRTVLGYLMDPITTSFRKSFREE
jgi:HlyD family type I secretion membrane fusion protein